MKRMFDPLEAIFELIDYVYSESGRVPAAVIVSRNSYRRLLEIIPHDCKVRKVKNSDIPVAVISTPWGDLQLIIDELLEDTRVEVDG